MVGQTKPQQKQQLSRQPSPRDEAKKIVSEILKRVDQFILNGDLLHAQLEVNKAKEVDPRNVYVFALEERISILTAAIGDQDEPQRKNESACSPTTGYPSKLDAIISQIPAVQKSSPVLELMTPSNEQSPPATTYTNKTQENREDRFLDRSVELKSYREALTEAWCDGALTEAEKQHLYKLRTIFDITEADCEEMEMQVKHECYRDALLRQYTDNPTDVPSSIIITELQRSFQISDDEHRHIQTQLINTISHKQRDTVLVVDDDIRLLELLAASLEDSGFEVTALSSSDEAYALLRKFVPDLILCDINLETSSMNGFTFYEKVQELKNAQGVPFVFLTGLTDETLVRTGKELGVDDYLLKPISEETLVSTLRGKLKRFRQLNKIMTALVPAMAAA